MDKVLSISIASYNVEKTIERTLDSLTKNGQILDKIEILVVNDGSTDGTLKIVNEYEKKYPNSVIVINKENGGYGSTINAALAIASGKYFRLLDGDDTFVNDNLLGFVDMLSKEKSDLIISPYNEVFGNIRKSRLIDNHIFVHDKIGLTDIVEDIVMHEITVKTNVLRRLNLKITEQCFYTDNEYVFYVLMVCETVSKYEYPIYNYFVGQSGQSVSVNGVKEYYKDTIIVAQKICDLYCEWKSQNETKNRKVLENKLETVIKNVYGSFLLIDSEKKYLSELKMFDRMLKMKYREIYNFSMKDKKIALMRRTFFLTYSYLCRREKKRRRDRLMENKND